MLNLRFGVGPMTDYRLYCLNSAGKIERAEWITAKTEEEAIVLARIKKLRVNCELWEGNRLVTRIPSHVLA
jgi:hypothetical protein